MKILVWYFHLVHLKKCLENSIHLKILATFFCFFALVACSFKDKEKKPRKFRFAWLFFIKNAIPALSLFCLSVYWGVCQTPNLSHHRAGCCGHFHP